MQANENSKLLLNSDHHICIVGGGLVGLFCALHLSKVLPRAHGTIALIAPLAGRSDPRTTAMLMPTIDALETLNLWKTIKPRAAALKIMRLIDGSERLIRAPIAEFKAGEIDLEAFGYNVPNAMMIEEMELAINNDPRVVRIEGTVVSGQQCDGCVELQLDNNRTVSANLTIAADGKNSLIRSLANIKVKRWKYPQSAVVLSFSHSLPHSGVSAEFHTETGPFTQVPLPPNSESKNRSSLVWLINPSQTNMILDLDNAALSELVETKLHSSFGKCQIETKPVALPMTGLLANSFVQNRIALIGEAAHVFPPIGAQGFNLGTRDVIELGKSISKVSSTDPGNENTLQDYRNSRITDVTSRTTGVDIMNRSLLSNFLPVQAAKALGIAALNEIPFLRKMAMEQGLGLGLGTSVTKPNFSSFLSTLIGRK